VSYNLPITRTLSTYRLPLHIPTVCSSSPLFHSSPLRRKTSNALPTRRRRTSISPYVLQTKCFARVPSGRTGRTPVNGSVRDLYIPESKISTNVRNGRGFINGWRLSSVIRSGQSARMQIPWLTSVHKSDTEHAHHCGNVLYETVLNVSKVDCRHRQDVETVNVPVWPSLRVPGTSKL
jgi:hypothetical protein